MTNINCKSNVITFYTAEGLQNYLIIPAMQLL